MGTDDGSEEMGSPPEADVLSRALRRSRIANKLFDTDERVELGRYQLLEQVGAGGIGVVWGAWDPELERRVAIKLIRPTLQMSRDRILAEGQALAKLSHPNVIPVYDVGVFGDQVYLVMEWVRGQTLRAYCEGKRSDREIIRVYLAAGEGLYAAHLVGLIHRDFKPDNAIVGDDDRVRVLDFGLARGETRGDSPATELDATRGAGTPRYMAPEQAAGTTLTAAADQYAFCIALRETLGEAVPSWIEAIIAKGTQQDPSARFLSMRELLHALARDPARVWRRRALVAGALLAAGGAFALGTTRAADADDVCVGGAAEIAKTWSSATEIKMLTHLRGLGRYGAEEADRIAREMTAYGTRWATVHRETCLAHERHEMTEPVYERNLRCLAKARVTYDTVVEVLSTTPADRLSSVIATARGLPAVDRCSFEALSSTLSPPPMEITARAAAVAGEIDRARVLARTDDPTGVAVTATAVTHATELGYAPLVARAYLANGIALLAKEDFPAAVPVLDRAAVTAVDAFDDLTFVEAYARKVYAQMSAEQTVDANTSYAEHVAIRAGATGTFARALLFNNLGAARLAAGDMSAARSYYDRSLAEPNGGDEELLRTYANRALVTTDPVERATFFIRARTALTERLGANNRKTLDVRFQAAFFITDARRAEAELGELCGQYATYHPVIAENTISSCFYEQGLLAEARGDAEAARTAMQRIPVPSGPVREAADAHLLALDGELAAAADAARAIGDKYRGESWGRFDAADGYGFAAACDAKLGRHDAQLEDARKAADIYDQMKFLANMAHYQRRIARLRELTVGSR